MTDIYTHTVFDITKLDKKAEDGTQFISLPIKKDTRVLKPTKEDLTVSEPVTPDKIVEKLKIYGGCFVKNYLPAEDCDTILNDIMPHLDAYHGAGTADNFISQTTRRVGGTCVKSKTAAEKFLAHPLNIAVSDRFLSKENLFRLGDDQVVTGLSRAQHNSCITFAVGPGSEDQPLHRDDILHHNIRKYMETYEFGGETAVGTALALKKTSKECGATRFIPGSHLWDHYRTPREDETVYAEMEKGDCFFMLASCYHGGSANTTKDYERIIAILFMTQGTLRQEENIFLGTSMEYFKSLSIPALAALGLQISQPFCGWYEHEDPIKKILPESGYDYPQFKDVYKIDPKD
ncbi:unnamed protein product [Kuraishia capsulata CBS 1993]|uniref:Phytanoyl-CoA dioxygenase family protein n=1 Tax=Kuraishia capsulata CBS 1993 TaxID=1382522 RepID=W6MF65_9ASCO|nr:uncharacterized protein KUCA_T00000016001 [Kuraishia capsulata CBS 1993]CDK24056.1 unnamed protein product [Kuraishia capsulata CBS 1993]